MRRENTLALWLGAAAAVLVWDMWAGGTAAFLMVQGEIPRLELGEAVAMSLQTLLRLSDPAGAWPNGQSRNAPAAGWFYLGWLLASILAVFAVAAISRLITPFKAGRTNSVNGEDETARWARGRDLKPLRAPTSAPGRLTLGRVGHRLVAAERGQSVLVVAPTQSGKTTGLVVPAILEWQGPVICTSVKNDLLQDTLDHRRSLGEAMVFDPTGCTSHTTTQATPLSGCGTWQTSREMAHWLCAAARPAGDIQEASFWYGQAEKLLAPLLYSARRHGLAMEHIVGWLDMGPQATAEIEAGLTDEPRARAALQAMMAREPKQLSSIYATAELVLSCFADPAVAAASVAPGYTPERLLDGKANTLYLVAPVHEQERLAPLFAAMIQDAVRLANQRANAQIRDHEPPPPLLLALDELANIAPVPQLEKLASTGAAQGIQLLSVVQDFAQLRERFGAMRAQTIINNHRAKIFGTGISDPETLNYLQQITGAARYTQHSETRNDDRPSTTESDTYRDLIPPNQAREQRIGQAILVYGSLPPARIRLRPWYADRKLRQLTTG